MQTVCFDVKLCVEVMRVGFLCKTNYERVTRGSITKSVHTSKHCSICFNIGELLGWGDLFVQPMTDKQSVSGNLFESSHSIWCHFLFGDNSRAEINVFAGISKINITLFLIVNV